MKQIPLRGLTLPRLQELVHELELEPYRARQIFSWTHGRGITDMSGMTNISKEVRARLVERFSLSPLEVDTIQSAAGGTEKLRLRCNDGALIETVLIPDGDKITQCLSSQVGCGLGCRFCATATMGLKRGLKTEEITGQMYAARERLPEGSRISNLVFMGMGEPMNNLDAVLDAVEILCTDLGANFSPRRITISTAGVVPGIQELGKRMPQVGLAISLNATTDEVRSELMPVNKRYPLAALFKALRRYPLPRRRRITFEYVLIKGINDSLADAGRIPALLHKIRAKVNLIAYNPGPAEESRVVRRRDSDQSSPALTSAGGVAHRSRATSMRSLRAYPANAMTRRSTDRNSCDRPLGRPDPGRVEEFAEVLRRRGLTTVVRRSRGADIAAACGQLVAGPF